MQIHEFQGTKQFKYQSHCWSTVKFLQSIKCIITRKNLSINLSEINIGLKRRKKIINWKKLKFFISCLRRNDNTKWYKRLVKLRWK